jgi:hypothetical protein
MLQGEALGAVMSHSVSSCLHITYHTAQQAGPPTAGLVSTASLTERGGVSFAHEPDLRKWGAVADLDRAHEPKAP